MTGFLRELHYSARSFTRAPAPTLALIGTLALGIGGNAALDGFVRGFSRPAAPLGADPRVVSIFGRAPGALTAADYHQFRTLGGVFEWVGAARITSAALTVRGQPAIARVASVTPNLAAALELTSGDGVIVNRGLWQNESGSNSDPPNARVLVDGVERRVAGVAPEWLEGLYRERPVDLWLTIGDDEIAAARATPNVWVVGRLRAGVPAARAAEATGARVVRYTGAMPETAAGMGRIVTLLQIAAGAVLFAACANVIAFLLGRAAGRSQETALRVALGAGFGRLGREVAADSVAISVAGGALATLLALWIARTMPALLFEGDAQKLVFAPDPLATVARCGVCVLVTAVCGLAPLFFTAHGRPAMVLRRESAGPSKPIRRLRLGLVAAQMASCCVLVVSTAYLSDGFAAAVRTSAGRRLGRPVVARVEAEPVAGSAYFRRVEDAARATPGITGVAWAGRLPGAQPAWQTLRIEPPHLPTREVTVDAAPFTSASLPAFGLPPKRGRMFGFGDGACRVAVVNEAAAAKLFGDATVGRTLQDSSGATIEVVGVLATRAPGARPAVYFDHTRDSGAPPATVPGARFRAQTEAELARAEFDVNVVSANYFEAMGLPAIAGRTFRERTPSDGCRVAVVNREAAEQYFGGRAIGNAVIDVRGRRATIIGVVEAPPLGAFQRRGEPAIYLPMDQDLLPSMTLIAGSGGDPTSAMAELRSRILPIRGGGLKTSSVQTLEAYLTQTALAPLRIAALMVGASATLALVLSAVGLFGALSDTARQRRREVAVRIALGAQRRHVIGLVFREGGRLASFGAVAGSAGAAVAVRWLAGILPGANTPSWSVWLAAPIALFATVAVASALPARRASIINPVSALREEN